jgi:hypothetical protein
LNRRGGVADLAKIPAAGLMGVAFVSFSGSTLQAHMGADETVVQAFDLVNWDFYEIRAGSRPCETDTLKGVCRAVESET